MKRAFVSNGIYHVFNRGVDKRDIFMEDADYFRCIHDIFEFNDTAPAFNLGRESVYFRNPSDFGGSGEFSKKSNVDDFGNQRDFRNQHINQNSRALHENASLMSLRFA